MLLAHELGCSKQCEKLGGKAKFGYYDFKEFKKAGQNYENNQLAREANDFQGQFARWLFHYLANDKADLEQSQDKLGFLDTILKALATSA